MQPVERIFLGEGANRLLPVVAAPAHELAHVAAGGEGLLARGLYGDGVHLRFARKAWVGAGKLPAHRRIEGVERTGPVERDDRQRPAHLDRELLGGLLDPRVGPDDVVLHSWFLTG